MADTVRMMAEQANPALVSDSHYIKNSGTLLSLEEQQAVQAIQRCLQDLRLPGAP